MNDSDTAACDPSQSLGSQLSEPKRSSWAVTRVQLRAHPGRGIRHCNALLNELR